MVSVICSHPKAAKSGLSCVTFNPDMSAEIDTGSNTSIEAIRKLRGKKFEINVAPPVEVLLSKDEDHMVRWLHRTIKENQNGNLKIVYHMEVDYNERSCVYISEYLSENGLLSLGRLY